MPELPPESELRRSTNEYRWCAEVYARAVRFWVALTLSLSVIALGVLKMEGPVFGDALAAAVFVCGFFASVAGVRSLRASGAELSAAAERKTQAEHKSGLREGDPQPYVLPSRGVRTLLVVLAVFYLGAAVATVVLTYITPSEPPVDPDALAMVLLSRWS